MEARKPKVFNCRSCSKPIMLIKTELGKDMPVDAASIPTADVRVGDTVITSTGKKIYVKNDRDFDRLEGYEEVFKPHWIECNDGDRFRKRDQR